MGSTADAQFQLGNAVPSLLAEILAREIRRQLLGHAMTNEPPRFAVPPAERPSRVPARFGTGLH